jgi:glycogen debranching enzyme
VGFFTEAALAAASSEGRRVVAQRLRQLLDGIVAQVDEAGLDHVSEVFDSSEPQVPGGTFAQAWNSGELLRAHALVAEALR